MDKRGSTSALMQHTPCTAPFANSFEVSKGANNHMYLPCCSLLPCSECPFLQMVTLFVLIKDPSRDSRLGNLRETRSESDSESVQEPLFRWKERCCISIVGLTVLQVAQQLHACNTQLQRRRLAGHCFICLESGAHWHGSLESFLVRVSERAHVEIQIQRFLSTENKKLSNATEKFN